jgi:MFS family permease
MPTLLFILKIPGNASGGKRPREKLSASLGLLKLPELRRALIASALALYSRDIFVAYFPLYADSVGISASGIGWILSIQGMMMVAVRFFLTRLTDGFGRDRVLAGSIVIAGLSFLFMPFTHNAVLLGVLGALMGAGLGCGQPLSMATTYNASPKSKTGEALGLRLMVNRLSQLIAPMFFGVIGASLGLISVFVASGVFLLAGTLAIGTRSGRPPSDPPDPASGRKP